MTVYPLKEIPVDTTPTLSAEEKAARDRQRAEEKERYEAAERERVFREYGVVVNESA